MSDVWAQFHTSDNVEDRRAAVPPTWSEQKTPEMTLEELIHSLGIMPPLSPLGIAAGAEDIGQRDPIAEFLSKDPMMGRKQFPRK